MAILGVAVAVLFSALNYFFWRWNYDWSLSRRLRRVVLEHFGNKNALRCEIELQADDVWICQDGTETIYPACDLDEVVDTPDGMELRFRNGGLVVARDRGFLSVQQRTQFLALAKTLA